MHFPIEGLILDFDGTLLDSFRVGRAHISMLCARHGLTLTEDIWQSMLVHWGHAGIDFIQQSFDIPRGKARDMYIDWENCGIEESVPLIIGAKTALTWCKREKIPVSLLTSRHRESLMHILEREGLHTDCFLTITSGADSRYRKPEASAFNRILLEMMTHRGITKNRCLYVGDTAVDIEAGKNAGIRTVVVQTGPYPHAHHKTHPMPMDHVITSVAILPLWIKNFNSKKEPYPRFA